MKKKIYLFTIMLIFIACGGNNDDMLSPNPSNMTGDNTSGDNTSDDNTQDDNTSDDNTNSGWLIPFSQVKDGGPGKDGIPSINSPRFVKANDAGANFLEDTDLVIGIIKGGIVRAYPHLILDWHEIVNDSFNQDFVSINYCPLTGTAFGWKSVSNGEKSTFGVSGLLYNANLILYDRNTDSYWSQLKLQCVSGALIGDEPILERIVETNWGTWKALYPTTRVLSLDTGFKRNYDFYPYGDYKTNQGFFLFSVTPTNNELPNKERVYAIIDEHVSKVYQFGKFSGGKAIKELFNGKEYLVVGNENLINSFELNESQLNLNFEYDFTNSEVFFKDDEGNKWSVFGEAIEGPRTGEMLNASKAVVSYWFAIAAFYPNPERYIE
ncbi:MAG: hypothetical protein COB01_04230 [Lutibacter sp.]|nr:MAG: hypothetical protein COB01_04230 [Lutibacter sp.]